MELNLPLGFWLPQAWVSPTEEVFEETGARKRAPAGAPHRLSVPRLPNMARPPPLGPRSPSEPFSHPPGAPRELDTTGETICIASGEESIR